MRDKDIVYENGICTNANYSLNDDGSIRVRNNEWHEEDGEWDGGTGQATIDDPSQGFLWVKFGPLIPAGPYQILETDYENFSVVYTCDGILDFYNIEYMWILTREANPTQEVLDKAMDVVRTRIPHYKESTFYATP